jgi:hypothetical protein
MPADIFTDASQTHLYKTLSKLLRRYPELEDEAREIFEEARNSTNATTSDAVPSKENPEGREDEEVQTVAVRPVAGAKRKAGYTAQPLICVVCDHVFQERALTATSCRHHVGTSGAAHWQLTSGPWSAGCGGADASQATRSRVRTTSWWAATRNSAMGTVNPTFARREYPERYIWTCCGRCGDESLFQPMVKWCR